ncbi:MAG: hypothetical protein JXA68_05280, partial [Ignavibacteriales bacterium]|nr:hypothetical protein [Ignavibacteriales bacterium]
MIVQFSIIDILLIVGIIQGSILIIVLYFNKKGNKRANRFLSIFIFCFILLTIGDVLTTTKLLYYYPHFLLVFDPLIFALAPLSYFYVKSLTNKNWSFNLISFIHFIPAILLYLIFSTVYLENFEIKQDLIIDSYTNYDNSTNYFLMTAVIQSLIYLLLNLKMI